MVQIYIFGENYKTLGLLTVINFVEIAFFAVYFMYFLLFLSDTSIRN